VSGSIVFIGAGPGAADLITVRGARRLATAEVVLHDALIDPALHDLAPHATWIDVGKRGFRGWQGHAVPACDATGQARINALIVKHVQGGRRVVRLKGGDPSVFGRLEEELQALAQAGIDDEHIEVVPGVTAALAAAAATRRPLTRRGAGRGVALTTAMTREGELRAVKTADSEVFYMAGRQLGALARRLAEAGWLADTPVVVVSRAGWPDQLASEHRVATLGEAALLHSGRPTVVTVGVGARAVTPEAMPRLTPGETLPAQARQAAPKIAASEPLLPALQQ
jgi:uroporphyrin-III C-methyltransferase